MDGEIGMDNVVIVGKSRRPLSQDFRIPVLSAMILDPGCAAQVLGELGRYPIDDVFSDKALCVARSIASIVREGKLPTFAIVLEHLRSRGELDKAISEEEVRGIATYLTTQAMLDVTDVFDWVNVVLEDVDRRLTKAVLSDAMKTVETGSPAPEVRRQLMGQLINISRPGEEKEGFKPLVSAVEGLAEAAEDWFNGRPHGRTPTGLADIDYMLGGGLQVKEDW